MAVLFTFRIKFLNCPKWCTYAVTLLTTQSQRLFRLSLTLFQFKIHQHLPVGRNFTYRLLIKSLLLISDELIRATLYQLHKRETTTVVQPHHVYLGTSRVSAWGYWVDFHRLRSRFAAHHWSTWKSELSNYISLLRTFATEEQQWK